MLWNFAIFAFTTLPVTFMLSVPFLDLGVILFFLSAKVLLFNYMYKKLKLNKFNYVYTEYIFFTQSIAGFR